MNRTVSGSADEDEEDPPSDSDDEDDEDIFENPPPKTKNAPPTNRLIPVIKRKEEVLAPIDVLEVGGKFADANGQPGHTRLRVKFVQETEKVYNSIVGQASFCIAVNPSYELKPALWSFMLAKWYAPEFHL
jgi:hypothetical protein